MKLTNQQVLARERSAKLIQQAHGTACDDKITRLRKQLTENRNSKTKVEYMPSQFQGRLKHNSFQRMKHQLQQLQNISHEFGHPCENTSSLSNGRVSATNLSANSCVMNKQRIRAAIKELEPETHLSQASQSKNAVIYKLKKMISEPNEFFAQQRESPRQQQRGEKQHVGTNSKSFTQLKNQMEHESNSHPHGILTKDEGSNSCYISLKPLEKTNFTPQNAHYSQSNKASAPQQPVLMNLHKKTQSMLVKKAEHGTTSKVGQRGEKLLSIVTLLTHLEQNLKDLKVDTLHNQKSSQSQHEFGKLVLNQKIGKGLAQGRKELKSLMKKLSGPDESESDYVVVPRALGVTLSHIFENMFEIQEAACVSLLIETFEKTNDLSQAIERQKEQLNRLTSEHQVTMNKMKEEIENSRMRFTVPSNHLEVDKIKDSELREFAMQLYEKLQTISEKESKLIKLVLAIKHSGVDIEKIYNEEVLNDEESVKSYRSVHKKGNIVLDRSFLSSNLGLADNSIINDSQESSSSYFHQQVNESVLESLRGGVQEQFQKKHQALVKPSIKIKLDLSKIKPSN